uniref:Uncharacterized protein n=1 Tax=Anguilla anguilla TaxID=7936 RepID=A0A0E9SL39_ANGAN
MKRRQTGWCLLPETSKKDVAYNDTLPATSSFSWT